MQDGLEEEIAGNRIRFESNSGWIGRVISIEFRDSATRIEGRHYFETKIVFNEKPVAYRMPQAIGSEILEAMGKIRVPLIPASRELIVDDTSCSLSVEGLDGRVELHWNDSSPPRIRGLRALVGLLESAARKALVPETGYL